MNASTRSKLRPSKTELANFRVMSEQGYSPNAIGKLAARDPKTIRKYLRSEIYNDPDLASLCEVIRAKESEDLLLIGAKSRARIHELIPNEKNIIHLTAIMDRSFQQRRLIEGKSTSNKSFFGQVYVDAEKIKPDYEAAPVMLDGTPKFKRT